MCQLGQDNCTDPPGWLWAGQRPTTLDLAVATPGSPQQRWPGRRTTPCAVRADLARPGQRHRDEGTGHGATVHPQRYPCRY
jgi:hypothetical protein